ncbi:MAG: Ig-like domain-containing protein [Anaerovoracaceae bacterium]|jgi:hypothetical protein|nr:Ig-like domain-containing protein [Anaerovoracaceae bacterium]
MRRIGAVISLIIVLVLSCTTLAFGALELERSYPEDGGIDYQAMNFAVKLYFNQNVAVKENAESVHFYDADNKKVDFTVVFSEKEEGLALVAANGDLQQNMEYRLVVDDTFQSLSGEFLEEDIHIKFSTRDSSKDMTVNMVLMGVMMAAVVVLSTRTMKKSKDGSGKDGKDKKEEKKVNPYKVAKEKGKSVEEIVAKDQRAKEKSQLAAQKAKEQKEKDIAKILEEKGMTREEASDPNRKKVKAPRPIKEAGSDYKSGTKAREEAKKKEAAKKRAATTTNPKQGKGKAKKKK